MKSVGSVPFTSNYNRLLPQLRRQPPAGAATSPNHSPSPLRPSSIVIPFSWEKKPGIPKTHTDPRANPHDMVDQLPLPPPFKSNTPKSTQHSNNKKKAPKALDPFSAALMECAGDWTPAAARRRAEGIAGRLVAAVGMHGSCMDSCSVVEPTVCVPRASFRRAGRDVSETY